VVARRVVDRQGRDAVLVGLLMEDDPLIVKRVPRRRRLRLPRATRPFFALALVLGGLSAGAGVLVQASPPESWRLPMTPGAVFTVPPRVLFAGPLVVFGSPGGEFRPTLEELGCRVTEGGGPVTLPDETNENRLVIADRGVVPLAVFPGRPGHSIACSGPGAEDAAPLFVAPGHTSRQLVPVAAYSLAALLIPAGAVGLASSRGTPL
jgi:hypothetical protein